jgi:hypothetical protein
LSDVCASNADMKVTVTLNRMNSGRMQLACVRCTNESGGIGTGYALKPYAPDAGEELKGVLGALGVGGEIIASKMELLSAVSPGELVKVAELDVSGDVLRANGFLAV